MNPGLADLRPRTLWLLGLGSALAWTALAAALAHGGWLERPALAWVDQLFAWRQDLGRSPAPNPSVVIIGIDEATLAAVRAREDAALRAQLVAASQPDDGATREDRWLLRRILGQLLVQLSRDRAKVVAVDYMLDRPLGPAVDGPILAALGAEPASGLTGVDVVFGSLVTLREQKQPIPAFRELAQEGNLAMLPDADGIYRRCFPGYVIRKPAEAVQYALPMDQNLPTFAVQACRVFVGTPDETGSALATSWVWPAVATGGVEVAGHFRTPTDTLIDFVGPAQTFELLGRQIRALDLMDGKVPAGAVAGKLVFIGPVLRHNDRFTVSVNPRGDDDARLAFVQQQYADAIRQQFDRDDVQAVAAKFHGAMSGIEIHANIACQVLDGRYLYEINREQPWAASAGSFAVTALLGGLFWRPLSRTRRHPLLGGVTARLGLFALVAAAAVAGSVVLLLASRTVFIPLELLIAWTGQAVSGTAFTTVLLRRQNQRIEAMYGSAVGDELLAYLKAHPELAGRTQRREATVLFCDIRGFTPLSEGLDPDRLVDLLRAYFEALWTPLNAHGAWVDKYVGDLVMAAWNVCKPMDDHALRAVRAALGMKAALAELNARRRAAGEAPIVMGIGIHSGPLVFGEVGSRQRRNYTLLGDTVNLASRIEGQTKGGEILVSEQTRALLGGAVQTREWGTVPIKGKTGTYRLFEVVVADA